jgi:hypothetical protein
MQSGCGQKNASLFSLELKQVSGKNEHKNQSSQTVLVPKETQVFAPLELRSIAKSTNVLACAIKYTNGFNSAPSGPGKRVATLPPTCRVHEADGISNSRSALLLRLSASLM